MNWRVPYFQLLLGEEEKQAVSGVLESNWLTSGPKLQEFEEAFSARLEDKGVKSVAVSNCTVGLHLAVESLGIGEGDEVICPALTFVATSNAILYAGAKPVFADIVSLEDWTISPADILQKITNKTKAILPVHYGGYPCDMDAIRTIATQYKLRIIEDVSHAPIVRYGNSMLGTLGDLGCFSFFSNKNLTTGEGGMVVTKDTYLVERLKRLRSHGMTTSSYERFRGHAFGYDVTEIGYNYRMDEIRAAIGIEQLKKLDSFQRKRIHILDVYKNLLKSVLPEITYPFQHHTGDTGAHIFPILLPEQTNRDEIMTAMAMKGIQTSIHYRPIHTFSAYADHNTRLPLTESIAPRILSLPLYPSLTESQIEYVVLSLKESLGKK